MSIDGEADDSHRFREADLPRSLGVPQASGRIRVSEDDFRVDEQLSFEANGEGDHWLVRVEKRGANTEWMAGQLARLAGVRRNDVGYAGLKDRHAVTRQWFTVPVTSAIPEPGEWNLEQGRVIDWARHRRKLRKGALSGNRFRIVVRDLAGDGDALDRRLGHVASQGIPNYFGPQRFGREGDNVSRLLRGRLPRRGPLRGILLSAGRAWLFNAVLAERVHDGNWCHPLPGELMMLDGSRSFFAADDSDPAIDDRCRRGDIHPSGPLWGQGPSPASDRVAEYENAVAGRWPDVVERLEAARMDHDRRALRIPVSGLEWTRDADSLRLDFELPAGAFATAVLREFLNLEGEPHD